MLTPYLERHLDRRNEADKQPHRDRVGRHLLDHHPRRRLRLFSLPSAYWQFERQIDAAWGSGCTFVGCEREASVVLKARPWMPGERPRWFRDEARGSVVEGVKTSRATFLNADAAHFCRLSRTDLGSRGVRRQWRQKYRDWTAVWLDFSCQTCLPVEMTLPTVGSWCDRFVPAAPVAVTVMKGREAPRVGEKLFALWTDRAGYLASLLDASHFRRFVTDDVFEHGSGGTTMLTVCGRLVSREQYTRGDRDANPSATETK